MLNSFARALYTLVVPQGGGGEGERERGMNCSRECEFLVRLCLWMATWFSFTLERRLLMSLRIRVEEEEREEKKKSERE